MLVLCWKIIQPGSFKKILKKVQYSFILLSENNITNTLLKSNIVGLSLGQYLVNGKSFLIEKNKFTLIFYCPRIFKPLFAQIETILVKEIFQHHSLLHLAIV